MPEKIAITGANGFIGEALVKALHTKGYDVLALVHHLPAQMIKGVTYHLYELGEKTDASLFEGVEVLVHGAFQMNPVIIEGEDINIRAARMLRSFSIPVKVFISSLSAASPVIPSYYAQTKREIETIFANELVIRPGLVLGKGGMFKRIEDHLTKSRWVPLIEGGRQPIQTILIDDLITTLLTLVENRKRGVYDLAYPQSIAYRDLVKRIAEHAGAKVRFLSTPYFLLRGMVAISKWLGVTTISNDNLLGLYHSRTINTHPLFQEMGEKWVDAEKAIRDGILPTG